MTDISTPYGIGLHLPLATVEDTKLTEGEFHSQMAAAWFNEVWRLIEKKDRSVGETDRMIHGAHASRLHWEYVGEAKNWTIGEWLISRVYVTLRRAEPALWHARRAVEIAHEHKMAGFSLATTYEAMARALRLYPHEAEQAENWLGKARQLLENITDPEERQVLQDDIQSNELLAGELRTSSR